MNILKFILSSLFCSYLFAAAMPEVENFRKKLEKVIVEVDNLPKETDVTRIVFLGKTRCGKSTLLNYIADISMVFKKAGEASRSSYDLVDVEDSEDKAVAVIGHGQSATTKPNVAKIGGKLFFDCPGLEHIGDPIQEIANAFYIHHVLGSSVNPDDEFGTRFPIKLVLVFEDAGLHDRAGAGFVSFITSVTQLIPNWKSYVSSVALVITKGDPAAVSRYRTVLGNIIVGDGQTCPDIDSVFLISNIIGARPVLSKVTVTVPHSVPAHPFHGYWDQVPLAKGAKSFVRRTQDFFTGVKQPSGTEPGPARAATDTHSLDATSAASAQTSPPELMQAHIKKEYDIARDRILELKLDDSNHTAKNANPDENEIIRCRLEPIGDVNTGRFAFLPRLALPTPFLEPVITFGAQARPYSEDIPTPRAEATPVKFADSDYRYKTPLLEFFNGPEFTSTKGFSFSSISLTPAATRLIKETFGEYIERRLSKFFAAGEEKLRNYEVKKVKIEDIAADLKFFDKLRANLKTDELRKFLRLEMEQGEVIDRIVSFLREQWGGEFEKFVKITVNRKKEKIQLLCANIDAIASTLLDRLIVAKRDSILQTELEDVLSLERKTARIGGLHALLSLTQRTLESEIKQNMPPYTNFAALISEKEFDTTISHTCKTKLTGWLEKVKSQFDSLREDYLSSLFERIKTDGQLLLLAKYDAADEPESTLLEKKTAFERLQKVLAGEVTELNPGLDGEEQALALETFCNKILSDNLYPIPDANSSDVESRTFNISILYEGADFTIKLKEICGTVHKECIDKVAVRLAEIRGKVEDDKTGIIDVLAPLITTWLKDIKKRIDESFKETTLTGIKEDMAKFEDHLGTAVTAEIDKPDSTLKTVQADLMVGVITAQIALREETLSTYAKRIEDKIILCPLVTAMETSLLENITDVKIDAIKCKITELKALIESCSDRKIEDQLRSSVDPGNVAAVELSRALENVSGVNKTHVLDHFTRKCNKRGKEAKQRAESYRDKYQSDETKFSDEVRKEARRLFELIRSGITKAMGKPEELRSILTDMGRFKPTLDSLAEVKTFNFTSDCKACIRDAVVKDYYETQRLVELSPANKSYKAAFEQLKLKIGKDYFPLAEGVKAAVKKAAEGDELYFEREKYAQAHKIFQSFRTQDGMRQYLPKDLARLAGPLAKQLVEDFYIYGGAWPARALRWLADSYYYAKGDYSTDYSQARALYEEALKVPGIDDWHLGKCRVMLGQIYYYGKAVGVNYVRARSYFEDVLLIPGVSGTAAGSANLHLGHIYSYGKDVSSDSAKAQKFYRNVLSFRGSITKYRGGILTTSANTQDQSIAESALRAMRRSSAITGLHDWRPVGERYTHTCQGVFSRDKITYVENMGVRGEVWWTTYCHKWQASCSECGTQLQEEFHGTEDTTRDLAIKHWSTMTCTARKEGTKFKCSRCGEEEEYMSSDKCFFRA